jgi:hypothetical protein
MSPAALKRALDPAYIGSPFVQPFQFFDGDASMPMDLVGRSLVLFLQQQAAPHTHIEIQGQISAGGRVTFGVTDTSAWSSGGYSVEVRLDGSSVVVGRISVAQGAAALGRDTMGATQPLSAPGVVIAGAGVVQLVNVAIVIGGGSGGGTAAYVHTQASPSALWNVNHNLGQRPTVSLQTTGGVEFEGAVTHLSANQLQVQLSSPQTGLARCI